MNKSKEDIARTRVIDKINHNIKTKNIMQQMYNTPTTSPMSGFNVLSSGLNAGLNTALLGQKLQTPTSSYQQQQPTVNTNTASYDPQSDPVF